MIARGGLAISAAVAVALLMTGRVAGQQPPTMPAEHPHHHSADATADHDKQAEKDAVHSMTPGHHHAGPHMKLTAPRPQTPEDLARADAVVKTLRKGIEKYKDYQAALADGYRIFLPNVPQPEYHFTNYWNGFLEAFTFDPARPTSLLYRRTAGGYELVGAMYTLPKNATEEQMNARVPLSLSSWHLHINFCMPPRGQRATADWTKFGLAGSISTPEACAEAGGTFMPSIFGWMIHVYPFEDSPEKIWRH